jgi:putative transposase
LPRQVCGDHDLSIAEGHVSKDHVHLFASIPPRAIVSGLGQRRKDKGAYKLLAEFPHLREKFWRRHSWARGTLLQQR